MSKFDNARHVNISGASAVVCLEQLRLAMFAKSMRIRGLNAFLGNLIQRFILTEESHGSWLADYVSGCAHRIYEATLPPCLHVLPTFKALALLLYREFSVPSIGLRTIEDTAVVFPVDKALSEVAFLSVFVIAKSKDIALRIEKLTASALSRHSDLIPNGDGGGSGSITSRSGMAGFLSAAMEGKLPFRSMSIGFGDDGRSVRSARTLVPPPQVSRRMSLKTIGRQGSRSGSTSGGDKITPLHDDDECGDSLEFAREPRGQCESPKAPKRVSVINFSPLVERAGSVVGDDDPDTNTADDDDDETDVQANGLYAPPRLSLARCDVPRRASTTYAPPTARPPGSARPSVSSQKSQTSRSPQDDVASISPRCKSADQSGFVRKSLTPRSARESSTSKRSTVFPDAVGIVESPSPTTMTTPSAVSTLSARAYHTNTHGNGVPIDAAAASELANEELGESESRASSHSTNSSARDVDDIVAEAPVIHRRRSSETKDPRLRRISMLRSFRRLPPPSDLVGHFVVCGTPSNYSDFLLSLSDLDAPLAAVVFVTPRDLTEKDFQAYKLHHDLYFVRGSPVSMQVFHDARMLYARSILIMAYCATERGLDDASNNDALERMDANMADVDAITTHRFISEACQNSSPKSLKSEGGGAAASRARQCSSLPFIVAEMIRPSNTKFLVDRTSSSLYDETSSENEQRARDVLRDTKCLDDCFVSALYASGHIYFTNVMDALLGSCSQHTLLIEMLTQLITSGNMRKQLHADVDDAPARYRLAQVPVPARYHYRPYARLVEGLLLEDNAMALGIYRGVSTHLSPAFVFTNPPADELVTPHDLIFVIS